MAGGAAYGVRRLLEGGDADGASSAPTANTPGAIHRFVSRPDLEPPAITVVKPSAATAPGYLFLAPSSGPGQRGALIADDAGEVIWFHRTKATAMNLRAGRYRGRPVLTWWEGTTKNGLGEGEHVVADSSYREIVRFPAARGRGGDLHEFILTPQGTALITAWEVVTRSVDVNGRKRRHPVVGGVVQELELPSGRLLFDWHSLDHVALEESHAGIGPRFDYFHVNSIDIAPDGDLIVSARNTWAIYKISRKTGAIVWRLGGKRSDFTMGTGTVFAWQHDARSLGDGSRISLFDDGAAPPVEPQSRGLVLSLDHRRKRVTLLHKYVHHPGRLLAHYMGSTQILPNGNVLLGWGSEPYLTEFAQDGTMIYDAKLPRGGQNYRAVRFPWTGHPTQPPDVATRTNGGTTTLYASWNGATELASWRVETGTSANALAAVATVPSHGFETQIALQQSAAYAAVTALDAAGRELATSRTIRI